MKPTLFKDVKTRDDLLSRVYYSGEYAHISAGKYYRNIKNLLSTSQDEKHPLCVFVTYCVLHNGCTTVKRYL
jgi:hypothetical protein